MRISWFEVQGTHWENHASKQSSVSPNILKLGRLAARRRGKSFEHIDPSTCLPPPEEGQIVGRSAQRWGPNSDRRGADVAPARMSSQLESSQGPRAPDRQFLRRNCGHCTPGCPLLTKYHIYLLFMRRSGQAYGRRFNVRSVRVYAGRGSRAHTHTHTGAQHSSSVWKPEAYFNWHVFSLWIYCMQG